MMGFLTYQGTVVSAVSMAVVLPKLQLEIPQNPPVEYT